MIIVTKSGDERNPDYVKSMTDGYATDILRQMRKDLRNDLKAIKKIKW